MDIKYLYIVLSLKEILEHHRQKTIFHYSTVRDKKGTGYNTCMYNQQVQNKELLIIYKF